MNSLPKTVTRQRSDCDLNPRFESAPEFSTLTTRLPSHPICYVLPVLWMTPCLYINNGQEGAMQKTYTQSDSTWGQQHGDKYMN